MTALPAVGAHSVVSWYFAVPPDLSLNADALPAALPAVRAAPVSFVR